MSATKREPTRRQLVAAYNQALRMRIASDALLNRWYKQNGQDAYGFDYEDTGAAAQAASELENVIGCLESALQEIDALLKDEGGAA